MNKRKIVVERFITPTRTVLRQDGITLKPILDAYGIKMVIMTSLQPFPEPGRNPGVLVWIPGQRDPVYFR